MGSEAGQPGRTRPARGRPKTGRADVRQGWAPSVQAVPPLVGATTVSRRRLIARLDQATERRLTVLIGEAGAGKSTLLAGWSADRGAAWYTLTEPDRDLVRLASGIIEALALRVPAIARVPGELVERAAGPEAAGDERSRARASAGLIADALSATLTREVALVLDDFHELGSANGGVWLIEALSRQAPELLRIVISTRDPLPFSIDRLLGQGHATVLTGGALAFDRAEITAMLDTAGVGAPTSDVAAELLRVTAGWPAAVRLAIEALVDAPGDARNATLDRVLEPAGTLYGYLADEVLGRTGPQVRELLEAVASLPRFSADLCQAIGLTDADETIRSLEQRGLFLQPIGEGAWFTLHPLVRQHFVGRSSGSTGRAAMTRLRRAARWFETRGLYRDAIACWTATGASDHLAQVIERHGQDILAAGDVQLIVSTAVGLPGHLRSAAIDRLEGEARQVQGDWEGALACFGRVASAERNLDPGLAWRMGLIHHLRGDLDEALRTYRRGVATRESKLSDVALLAAWTASAQWLRGDAESTREGARAALEAASASGDDRALAAAHTIAAMQAALDGDRRSNDAHYLRAREHAARSNDLLQTIRIRANRGSHFLEEGYYDEAIDELSGAIASAEIAGFAAFHALALSNRGEALDRLGRLDEAMADLEAARRLYQRLESRLISYPLGHLADVQRNRGAYAVARANYEEAIEVSTTAGDVQGFRPALAGLAELLAVDDPERATQLASRAVELGPGTGLVRSLLSQGRVALAQGRRDDAQTAATAAAAEARGRRDRAGLAEAIELEASLATSAEATRARLTEALLIWRDLHAEVSAARVDLALADLGGDLGGDHAATRDAAEQTLRVAGASRYRMPAGAIARSRTAGSSETETLRVRTLGGFAVVRGGRAVAIAEWGSRKARDLFKILVARRGQHVLREQLEDLLWPGESRTQTARRLSVAISTVRAVLDPEHRLPRDAMIAADRNTVWLQLDQVRVDVEAFLADAAAGLELAVRGQPEAVGRLRAAEAAYRGDFLVEDAFEDWAAGLREECRQAYVGVCEALAQAAAADGDHDAAIRYLRRVLEQDEYDERAHLALVGAQSASGRPADARRSYGRYLAAMEDLGVEAAPFPEPAPRLT